MKPYIILIALPLHSPVFADSDHPSIMFQKPPAQPSDIVTAPDTTDELAERCKEMSRQIELLKGKPQRRNIAIKRYNIECKGQAVDYDRYDNLGISQDNY